MSTIGAAGAARERTAAAKTVTTDPKAHSQANSHSGGLRSSPLSPTGWQMSRFMKIALERRGVSCVAQLLDKDAPRTCDAVWEALPLGGDAYHAKYARNEVYTMVERFATSRSARRTRP